MTPSRPKSSAARWTLAVAFLVPLAIGLWLRTRPPPPEPPDPRQAYSREQKVVTFQVGSTTLDVSGAAIGFVMNPWLKEGRSGGPPIVVTDELELRYVWPAFDPVPLVPGDKIPPSVNAATIEIIISPDPKSRESAIEVRAEQRTGQQIGSVRALPGTDLDEHYNPARAGGWGALAYTPRSPVNNPPASSRVWISCDEFERGSRQPCKCRTSERLPNTDLRVEWFFGAERLADWEAIRRNVMTAVMTSVRTPN